MCCRLLMPCVRCGGAFCGDLGGFQDAGELDKFPAPGMDRTDVLRPAAALVGGGWTRGAIRARDLTRLRSCSRYLPPPFSL
jgi:hypothetical protein